jgi:hypothetical protein
MQTCCREDADLSLLIHCKLHTRGTVSAGEIDPSPWSRGLLEKLRVSQLVKKFPAFYGTWRFIIAFTRTRHLSLS